MKRIFVTGLIVTLCLGLGGFTQNLVEVTQAATIRSNTRAKTAKRPVVSTKKQIEARKKALKSKRSGLTRSVTQSSVQNSTSKCTASAWTCTDFGPCSQGVKTRKCTLKDRQCLDSYSVEPPSQVSCKAEVEDQMIANIALWKKFHDDLLVRAKEYLQQGYPGRTGLYELDQIEEAFVWRFNAYVEIYRKGDFSNSSFINRYESEIQDLVNRFNSLPLIYF